MIVIDDEVEDMDIPAPEKKVISVEPEVLLCKMGPVRNDKAPSLVASASAALTVMADDEIDENDIPVPALRLTVDAPEIPSIAADDDDPAQDSIGVVPLMVILLAG